jgi:hypothetical protein
MVVVVVVVVVMTLMMMVMRRRRRRRRRSRRRKTLYYAYSHMSKVPYFNKSNLVMTISKMFCAVYLYVHTLVFF